MKILAVFLLTLLTGSSSQTIGDNIGIQPFEPTPVNIEPNIGSTVQPIVSTEFQTIVTEPSIISTVQPKLKTETTKEGSMSSTSYPKVTNKLQTDKAEHHMNSTVNKLVKTESPTIMIVPTMSSVIQSTVKTDRGKHKAGVFSEREEGLGASG